MKKTAQMLQRSNHWHSIILLNLNSYFLGLVLQTFLRIFAAVISGDQLAHESFMLLTTLREINGAQVFQLLALNYFAFERLFHDTLFQSSETETIKLLVCIQLHFKILILVTNQINIKDSCLEFSIIGWVVMYRNM